VELGLGSELTPPLARLSSFFVGREEEKGSESFAGSNRRWLFGFRRIFQLFDQKKL
jgi:hypothetical protein